MQPAAQICFFAHSPEEVRHPSTKPFVPPEALAAATTSATLEAVRKAAADSEANKKEVCTPPLMPCCCCHCLADVPACAAAPLQAVATDGALRT